MIFVQNVGVFFSGIALFQNISFNIYQKDKIGLVGKNGVGKSTILKLLSNLQSPSEGKIVIERGRTIGYLPQELAVKSTKSIKDEVLSIFEESIALEKRIKELEHLLSIDGNYTNEDYMGMAEELSNAHQHLDLLDVSNQVSNVEKVLRGIGFKDEEFGKPVSALSGGWQMRIELAKLLIKKPDLLLLDEPTNHLDIESIIWTENFLKTYPGAIMIISHDKTFLDQVTNRTIEVVSGKIYDYPFAYTKFLSHREERIRLQQAAFNNQQKYIEQQERFIDRFKAKASKAKQAQSKMKQLDKIERIQLDEQDTSSIRFEFPPPTRSGEVVVKAIDVRKTYGPKEIFKDVNFTILRGEKIAFVGKNGQGKTTMVKLINKKEDYEGEIVIGYNVKIGYYAQQQEKELNENITVLQTVEQVAKDEWSKEHKKRALLGAFLFDANDIDKKVKVLSGGEKSRLALACLLLQESNVLILDEPTNHLDMASKEVLKNALIKFTGTLIVVSHDRDFLDGLTNRTFEFSNGRVKEHLGDIQEFLNAYQSSDFRSFELSGKEKIKKELKPEVLPEKTTKIQNSDAFKEIKRLKNAIEKAEKKIEELEAKVKSIEDEIAQKSDQKDLYFKHAEHQRLLEEAMKQWENLNVELTKFES